MSRTDAGFIVSRVLAVIVLLGLVTPFYQLLINPGKEFPWHPILTVAGRLVLIVALWVGARKFGGSHEEPAHPITITHVRLAAILLACGSAYLFIRGVPDLVTLAIAYSTMTESNSSSILLTLGYNSGRDIGFELLAHVAESVMLIIMFASAPALAKVVATSR